ncbi:outer membrane beta-barrel protein [Lutimaribacter marinistellae]|uniref:Outer membrane beta-barrel protein n=1 Tax=Lutimaribacter marinistellae TaxID=1820329 RepID=A0ABV7TN85_9RHOB
MTHHRRGLSGAVFAACIAAGATPSTAQEGWDFNGYIYLWGAGIGGETVTGQDIEVSFGDIVDNLDFGLMGSLEANNGPWSIFGDALYLSVSKNQGAAVGPGIPANADVDVSGLVLTMGVGYDLLAEYTHRLNGFGGFRVLDMDTTANVAVAGGSQRLTDTINNWDAVVGLRGQVALNERWDLLYYADLGTGDSDLTWQAALAAEYKFTNWSLGVGYRHLSWEIDKSRTLSDLAFSGPYVGAKWSF